jgi:hypothetical protein
MNCEKFRACENDVNTSNIYENSYNIHSHFQVDQSSYSLLLFDNTVKLGYNDHGYNEGINLNFWSKIINLHIYIYNE